MSSLNRPSPGPGLFGYEGDAAPDGTPLADLPDLRSLVPDLEPYLLPFQRVLYVEEVYVAPSEHERRPPSSSRALLELMGVSRLDDIGTRGPGVAALPLASQADVAQVRLLDALFGRDSLHVGLRLFSEFPRLLRMTVRRLAELQGTEYVADSEEEPGRIVHWAPRANDPVAAHITAVNGWEWPNYGAVDSTPLFIVALCQLIRADHNFLKEEVTIERNGDRRRIADSFREATNWLFRRLDANAEGLLEFQMTQPRGVWNQAWKDTPESYMHADGSYANHRRGIASIEVQALAWEALLQVADLCKTPGVSTQIGSVPSDCMERACVLRQSVVEHFWIDDDDGDGGYLALATDRDDAGFLRPLRVRSSNMGHALAMMPDGDGVGATRSKLVAAIFASDLLDRNGIRTLGSGEIRFMPRSYHCGSVWPWDTHAIALQLHVTGYPQLADELELRILRCINTIGYFAEFVPGDNAATAIQMTTTRLIDLYDGERDHFSRSYRVEKPAQQTQAWTVEAVRAIRMRRRVLGGPDRSGATSSAPALEAALLSRPGLLGETNC